MEEDAHGGRILQSGKALVQSVVLFAPEWDMHFLFVQYGGECSMRADSKARRFVQYH